MCVYLSMCPHHCPHFPVPVIIIYQQLQADIQLPWNHGVHPRGLTSFWYHGEHWGIGKSVPPRVSLKQMNKQTNKN